MEYLQAANANPLNNFKKQFLKALLFVNFIAALIFFTLNFLGLPILKYFYLVNLSIGIIGILFFNFEQCFQIILVLFFIEGQGRILWEYTAWSRIVFDLILLYLVLKIFIQKKKIFDFSKVPKFFILFVTLHITWFFVQFFNINSLSYFAIIASSKIYLYPLLFFSSLIHGDFHLDENNFKKFFSFFLFLFFLELILTIHQFNLKESFILQISPYYEKAMRDQIFTGDLYRPFGTTNLPGAPSLFIFLTIGLFFIKKISFLNSLVRTMIILLSAYVLILCQIRSALIKFALILIIIYIGDLIYHRFKAKYLLNILGMFFVLFVATQYIQEKKQNKENQDLEYVQDRFASIGDTNKISSSRLSINQFFQMAYEKLLDHPLGIGPGLTGAIANLARDELTTNQFINLKTIWTGDNLFISLVIDFGIGAIFYILLILFIPFYFFNFLILFYKNKIFKHYKILLVSFATTLVIILGNWGAIGITYNPESFIFWLFSAIGFNTILKHKNEISKAYIMSI